MKRLILAVVFILGSVFIFKNDTQAHTTLLSIDQTNAVSHEIFNGLLKKYVTADGKVNYNGFKKDKVKLKKYLDLLKKNAPKSSWSRNEKIVYWINAYNAHTINLVIQKYPISSIMKIHGGDVWHKAKLNVGGKTMTLSDIENKILIGKYKEARVHFAINCAAKSCPPLMNKAWSAATLKKDLDKRTRSFINSKKYNTISAKSPKLSKIFEWYAKDFGNVTTFINKYSKVKISKSAKIKYNEYDWALNK
jgi:hypothetical protein